MTDSPTDVLPYRGIEFTELVARYKKHARLDVRISKMQARSFIGMIDAAQNIGLLYGDMSDATRPRRKIKTGQVFRWFALQSCVVILHHKVMHLWGFYYKYRPHTQQINDGDFILVSFMDRSK